MTPRRPDERTHAQRLDRHRRGILAVQAVELLTDRSTRRQVRRVYIEEVRRGTSCKVLLPD